MAEEFVSLLAKWYCQCSSPPPTTATIAENCSGELQQKIQADCRALESNKLNKAQFRTILAKLPNQETPPASKHASGILGQAQPSRELGEKTAGA